MDIIQNFKFKNNYYINWNINQYKFNSFKNNNYINWNINQYKFNSIIIIIIIICLFALFIIICLCIAFTNNGGGIVWWVWELHRARAAGGGRRLLVRRSAGALLGIGSGVTVGGRGSGGQIALIDSALRRQKVLSRSRWSVPKCGNDDPGGGHSADHAAHHSDRKKQNLRGIHGRSAWDDLFLWVLAVDDAQAGTDKERVLGWAFAPRQNLSDGLVCEADALIGLDEGKVPQVHGYEAGREGPEDQH